MILGRLILTSLVVVALIFVLRMPTRDISRNFDLVCYLDLDPEFREVPAWNILRWFFVALLLFMLVIVWFVWPGLRV